MPDAKLLRAAPPRRALGAIFFARVIRTTLFAAALATVAGCGRFAVRPNEKEFLADPVMAFDGDQQEAAADDHILSNREGGAGGRGTQGGGCGCN